MNITCNILIDALPTTISVAGRDIPISSDFRTAVLFELLMQDKEMTAIQKGIQALRLWFPEPIPEFAIAEATEELIRFYSCGRKAKGVPSGAEAKPKGIVSRIYDFDEDAPLIYAAFLSQYGIDLQDVKYLHWWKFSAMFAGLNEEHQIVKIMGYRAIDLSAIKNKAERARYSKLKAKYTLDSNKSVVEKEAMAGSLFAGPIFRGKE